MMERFNTLVSLNEAKKTIDELIDKVKKVENEDETDSRKLLVIFLSVLGALVVIGVIAYAVYHHFTEDYMDDYEDLDDVFDDEFDEDEDDEAEAEHNVYDDDFDE
ncbi:MAG: hypothetical protein IJR62_04205 [Lachnospiraceae bacterium]|jgi:hypothetical protein|nr:hypothetical protein [Lachnospiraceae bacterium]